MDSSRFSGNPLFPPRLDVVQLEDNRGLSFYHLLIQPYPEFDVKRSLTLILVLSKSFV